MPPTQKPNQTLADYFVIAISPVLIMLLVGSLSFFLIEVFFRGQAIGSVRWIMFWFVMAVVLVSRIGIEQGSGHAAGYGLALAAATWLYLVRIHPAFILGMILLGVVWWCAHKLTWDCTLIDETQDASGNGLLQTAGMKKKFLAFVKKTVKTRDLSAGKKLSTPHPPGLWVVYFSLAALPLFGIGQMLLPADDLAARHAGFIFLFIYLAAALGLLLTTSFLGLRRYLRQRYLPMPPMIAFGWIRFGVGVASFVLIGALLLPRPGANAAWQALHYQIDYKLRQASEYTARFSPPGKGQGRSGNETQKTEPSKNPTAASPSSTPPPESKISSTPDQSGSKSKQDAPSLQPSSERAAQFYQLFKILFLVALALLIGWWFFRKRDLIFHAIRSIIHSIAEFFRNLFGFRFRNRTDATIAREKNKKRRPFAAFQNPFLTGKEVLWTQAQLILYSFEAFRAWAEEQGIAARPEQTAREFCTDLGSRFSEINPELNELSFLYAHAAYATTEPTGRDLEPIKKLWRYFTGNSNYK